MIGCSHPLHGLWPSRGVASAGERVDPEDEAPQSTRLIERAPAGKTFFLAQRLPLPGRRSSAPQNSRQTGWQRKNPKRCR